MGFLHRLFTGKEDQSYVVRGLQTACRELKGEVDRLSDKLDELASEHRKLRGRFYAARGEVEKPQETREQMKLATLHRLGYVPGQPAPHK